MEVADTERKEKDGKKKTRRTSSAEGSRENAKKDNRRRETRTVERPRVGKVSGTASKGKRRSSGWREKPREAEKKRDEEPANGDGRMYTKGLSRDGQRSA